MNSFGFWLEQNSKNEQEPFDVDVLLNFNLWCEHSHGTSKDLDFGFKLTKANDAKQSIEKYRISEHVSTLALYCPFVIKEDQIIDLYDVLVSKLSKVLGAVFNEKCQATFSDSKPYTKVTFPGGSNDGFTICKISDFKTKKEQAGTLVRIELSDSLPEGPLYFRFKLSGSAVADLVQQFDSKDSPLTTAFSRDEIVDFRFNDYRTLPDLINDKVEGIGLKIHIRSVQAHFLLMTDSGVEVDSGIELKEKRLLEEDLWDEYFAKGHNKAGNRHIFGRSSTNIVAYHWKKTDLSLSDGFRLYLKLRLYVCNGKTIAKYLMILFVITFVFDVIEQLILKLPCFCFLGGGY